MKHRRTLHTNQEIVMMIWLLGKSKIVPEAEQETAYRLAEEGLVLVGIASAEGPLLGKLTKHGKEVLGLELERIGFRKCIKFLSHMAVAKIGRMLRCLEKLPALS